MPIRAHSGTNNQSQLLFVTASLNKSERPNKWIFCLKTITAFILGRAHDRWQHILKKKKKPNNNNQRKKTLIIHHNYYTITDPALSHGGVGFKESHSLHFTFAHRDSRYSPTRYVSPHVSLQVNRLQQLVEHQLATVAGRQIKWQDSRKVYHPMTASARPSWTQAEHKLGLKPHVSNSIWHNIHNLGNFLAVL